MRASGFGVVGLVFVVLAADGNAQTAAQRNRFHELGRRELPDDPPGFVPLRTLPSGPPTRTVLHPRYDFAQVNVDSGGNNIVGDAANEPSIAVDPTNPMRIAIGWRQFDTVASNFRQAGWAFLLGTKEHNLAKVEVVSSNLIARSNSFTAARKPS